MARRDRPLKAAEARAREVAQIQGKLRGDLGFPDESLADIVAAMARFETEGVGLTQTWKFRELGVAVTLVLSTQPHVESYARVSKLAGR